MAASQASGLFVPTGAWEKYFAVLPVDSWDGVGYRKRWMCWVERRVMVSDRLMEAFEEFRDTGARTAVKEALTDAD